MAPRRSGRGCPSEKRDKSISANAQRRGYHQHQSSSMSTGTLSDIGIKHGVPRLALIGHVSGTLSGIGIKSGLQRLALIGQLSGTLYDIGIKHGVPRLALRGQASGTLSDIGIKHRMPLPCV
jgi:sRNA-binding protein